MVPGAHEQVSCGLGGGVRRHPRLRLLGDDSADVRDEGLTTCLSGGAQCRQRGTQETNGREGIEREEVDHHLIGSLIHSAEGDRSRGVNDAIDPAVLGLGSLDDERRTSGLADIRSHREARDPRRAHAIGIATHQRESAACRGKGAGDRMPESPRRTHDDDGAIGEVGHGVSLPPTGPCGTRADRLCSEVLGSSKVRRAERAVATADPQT